MSHRDLQQVVVRMHFDPAYAAAVIAGAVVPPGLDAAERGMLARLDARAFRADAERPLRLLAAVVDEAPVTAAALGAAASFAFVRSDAFAAAIAGRWSVVHGFCAYAEAAGAYALLDAAIATARRRRVAPPSPGHVVRAPGVEVVALPTGTVAAYATARATLGATPLAAILDGARAAAAPAGAADEHALITPSADGPALATCGGGVAALLAGLGAPTPRAEVLAELVAHGADDAAALLDELVADGVLRGA